MLMERSWTVLGLHVLEAYLIRFFKLVTTIGPMSAEILAIKDACSLFITSKWVNLQKLQVETDCMLSLAWLKNNRDSNVSVRFSGRNTGKLHSVLDGNRVCEFSLELEDHFEVFEHIRGFNVTIVTSANAQDETLPPWSGFLQGRT
ncbi:hypothetical protein V6N13_009471 [Hibiscus sabdariffa]|uniref:RNase H type-1 domain-containing protein n=1 Tax=Hibiscus sabdariffa TaxID=183260 RepID=A0ABR2PP32_9ROSI